MTPTDAQIAAFRDVGVARLSSSVHADNARRDCEIALDDRLARSVRDKARARVAEWMARADRDRLAHLEETLRKLEPHRHVSGGQEAIADLRAEIAAIWAGKER